MTASQLIRSRLAPALVGVACVALAFPAAAKITEVFTISDFQPTIGGVQLSSIQSVTGSWTVGTNAVDDNSNVTVVENAQGQIATYKLTGREDGPTWTVPSDYNSCCNASFRINPVGAGPVSTGVSVSLNDFIYGGTGSVTITEKAFRGVPEPATWAMLILGLSTLGAMLRSRRPILAAASPV